MFNGIFQSPLDEKNRVVLPLHLRDSITPEELRDGFVVTQGFEGCLMMFLRKDWQALAGRYVKLPFTRARARRFLRLFLSTSMPAPIDRVGRLTIPDLHRGLAGVDREVLFSGVGRFIEIWAPERWTKYREENMARYEEDADGLFGGWDGEGPSEDGPAGSGPFLPGGEYRG